MRAKISCMRLEVRRAVSIRMCICRGGGGLAVTAGGGVPGERGGSGGGTAGYGVRVLVLGGAGWPPVRVGVAGRAQVLAGCVCVCVLEGWTRRRRQGWGELGVSVMSGTG